MFSQPAKTPITLIDKLSSASACIAPKTPAAPPISYFISSMPKPGFNEIPPLSNVRPLPTNTNGLESSPAPSYFMMLINDSLTEPRPTARYEPIPSSSISFSPTIVVVTFS